MKDWLALELSWGVAWRQRFLERCYWFLRERFCQGVVERKGQAILERSCQVSFERLLKVTDSQEICNLWLQKHKQSALRFIFYWVLDCTISMQIVLVGLQTSFTLYSMGQVCEKQISKVQWIARNYLQQKAAHYTLWSYQPCRKANHSLEWLVASFMTHPPQKFCDVTHVLTMELNVSEHAEGDTTSAFPAKELCDMLKK